MTDTNLGLRLATAAVLAPLLVVTIVIGRWLFLAAVLALALLATIEFFGLADSKPYRPRLVPGLALAASFPLVFYGAPPGSDVLAIILTVGVAGVAIAQLLDRGAEEATASVAFTVLGALYAGLLLGHLVLIRELSREIPGAPYRIGAILVVIPLVLTWVNDTVAYFVGRKWGKRRLAPRISPGKSVEGAAGALVATMIAGGIAGILLAEWFPLIGPAHGIAIGLLVGIASPSGDLIESAFKRDAGVKDSSQLVPGHGGILDRFDGLMLAAPCFYYYVSEVLL